MEISFHLFLFYRDPYWWIGYFNNHYFEVQLNKYLGSYFYKILDKKQIIERLKNLKVKIQSTSFFIPTNYYKDYFVLIDKKEMQKIHKKALKDRQQKMLFIL
jgi:hypothetical protein